MHVILNNLSEIIVVINDPYNRINWELSLNILWYVKDKQKTVWYWNKPIHR